MIVTRHSHSCFHAVSRTKVAACVLLSLFSTTATLSQLNRPAGRSIKLLTYNIHAWRDASHHCNFDRVVKIVEEVRPDVLCLNEVLHPFARPLEASQVVDDYYTQVRNNQGRDRQVDSCFLQSHDEERSFLHRLAQETSLPNIEFVGATENSYFGKGVWFGNAILTCHPILEFLPVPLPVEDGDLELGRQERDFVDPRSFGVAKVRVGDNHCLGVAFGHLDHKSEELREKQIATAVEKIQSFLKNTSHIICGDFNTFQKSDSDSKGWKEILDLYSSRGWPAPPESSLVLDALREVGYTDTFYECLQGDLSESHSVLPDPTSWSNNPCFRIDHIFVKNAFEERGARIVSKRHYRIDCDASDHFPVVLEATLES